MKMEEILKLIEAVSASELTDFKYEENGTKLNLKKEQQKVEIIQSPGVVPVTGTVTAGLQTAEILQNPGNEADHTQEEHQEVIKETEGELIVSPLVGTFYAAPAEDAPSFVKVGDKVEAGQVVGIIEAMKLMNEIESECAGTVAEVLVENGEPVEYGQPIFRIVYERNSDMNSLNVEQIQEIIPHRHPFLLIDKIEDYVPGEYAIGYKGVSYHEDFFRGHFPQKAVMPGVLILEALAQTGAVAILSVPENQGKIAFFGGVQKCRFKGMVFPGDQLKLETKIIKRKGPVGVGEAVATVNGKVVVTAELTFMVGE